ncbi:MAG: hypothetical protein QXP53_00490 [Candidatus Pacearchaeota archaeon]
MVKKEAETDRLLLENFITLQKKLAETVKEIKDIKTNLSDLLEIFKRAEQELKQEKHIALAPRIEEKLDKILEQNKMIAEGIVAIGENLEIELKKPRKVEREIIVEKEKPKKKEKKKSIWEESKSEESEETEEPEEESEESEESNEGDYNLEPLPEFNF